MLRLPGEGGLPLSMYGNFDFKQFIVDRFCSVLRVATYQPDQSGPAFVFSFLIHVRPGHAWDICHWVLLVLDIAACLQLPYKQAHVETSLRVSL